MKAYPLRAEQTAGPRAKPEKSWRLSKEGRKGDVVLKYLDESGFCLCLPPTHTWTLKGTVHQHRVRSRWGSSGRINLIGTPCLEGQLERLENSLMEGPCHSGEVKEYLDALAEQTRREGKPCVVVLDNAPFHTPGMIREGEKE